MANKSILFVGTGTNVGKTTLVTAVLRTFKRRGYKAAPFKVRNLSNNSAVVNSGFEISRSIALQCNAAGIDLDRYLNPQLVKFSVGKKEIIFAGKSAGMVESSAAGVDSKFNQQEIELIDSCFDHAMRNYDYVVAEGCGRVVGVINQPLDYGNLELAYKNNIPVVLVVDDPISFGSSAHLTVFGALSFMDKKYKHLIKGIVVTKTRLIALDFNQRLFDKLSEITGVPYLGSLPQIDNLTLDQEDGVFAAKQNNKTTQLKVIAPKPLCAANTTDLQPLTIHPDVSFSWVKDNKIPEADLVILPGSRASAYFAQWMKKNQWDTYLQQHLNKGGKILGICGGYQILGKSITDPDSVEGYSYAEGLGLLDVHTTYKSTKKLENVVGTISGTDISFNGYEIHLGHTESNYPPFATLHDGTKDGCVTENIIGTYCHGVLDNADSLDYILRWAGLTPTVKVDYNVHREQQIDKLADVFEQHLDLDVFIDIIEKGV